MFFFKSQPENPPQMDRMQVQFLPPTFYACCFSSMMIDNLIRVASRGRRNEMQTIHFQLIAIIPSNDLKTRTKHKTQLIDSGGCGGTERCSSTPSVSLILYDGCTFLFACRKQFFSSLNQHFEMSWTLL